MVQKGVLAISDFTDRLQYFQTVLHFQYLKEGKGNHLHLGVKVYYFNANQQLFSSGQHISILNPISFPVTHITKDLK